MSVSLEIQLGFYRGKGYMSFQLWFPAFSLVAASTQALDRFVFLLSSGRQREGCVCVPDAVENEASS